MLVKAWMSADVITVTEDTSVMKASQVIKETNVRHLPVLRDGQLIGIVSDRDLKEASPSKATTLDVHELYYLLSELKVKDIMSKKLVTIREDDTVEKAAVLMLENRVTALPVLDQDQNLVGMLSQGDVFRVLTAITGVYRAKALFAFNIQDRPGSIKEVADVIRKHGGRMLSILTSYDQAEEGSRHLLIRIADLEQDKIDAMTKELEQNFVLLYIVQDELADVKRTRNIER